MLKLLALVTLSSLLLAAIQVVQANQSKGLAGLLHDDHEHEHIVVHDETYYVRPGATPAEVLEARGYLAHEFHVTTRDNVSIAVTRGRNPLINEGQAGYKSRLPILFLHGATLSGASYLVNSRFVKPRVYPETLDLASMNGEQLYQVVREDPARFALPFLAMNFGHEVWLMERRGATGSRNKVNRPERTVADAFKAIPQTLIGNAMNGFSLDANMAAPLPRRVRFTRDLGGGGGELDREQQQEQRRPQSQRRRQHLSQQRQLQLLQGGRLFDKKARRTVEQRKESPGGHFSTADFKEAERERNPLRDFKPKTAAGKIFKRILKKGNELRRRLGPLAHVNMLESFFMLAKLPSTFAHLVGNITHEFVQTFDPEFWQFSLDQQAEFDFPEVVDFVLKESGAPKVHATGLSCGGAVILLALAERPELADKLSRAVLWAPSVNMGSKTDVVYLLGFVLPLLQGYVGPLPFAFTTPIIDVLTQVLCSSDFMQRTICTAAVDVIMGHSANEAPLRPFMLGHMLQPTSSGELMQLGQFARTQFPCKFSMNTKEENQRRYGQSRPPCYDLSQIRLSNMSFYGGNRDRLVSADDMATTITQLSVPAEINVIKGKGIHFNHLGGLLHKQADRLIIVPSLLDFARSEAADLKSGHHHHHHQHDQQHVGSHHLDLDAAHGHVGHKHHLEHAPLGGLQLLEGNSI